MHSENELGYQTRSDGFGIGLMGLEFCMGK